MSSFAINGRIVFDPLAGPAACAHAVCSDDAAATLETRRRDVGSAADARVLLLELVAALAIDIRARGGHVSFVDVD